ncbi:MAG: hypothetical protein ACRESZ_00030, partial [Methylococcales bacterium]
KPLRISTQTLTRTQVGDKVAETLAEQKFTGQTTGTVYVTKTGISLTQVKDAEAVRYIAASQDIDDHNTIRYSDKVCLTNWRKIR